VLRRAALEPSAEPAWSSAPRRVRAACLVAPRQSRVLRRAALEPCAEPRGHVYPPLLPHAPVVGGLGEAEIAVGDVWTAGRVRWAARSRAPMGQRTGRPGPTLPHPVHRRS
jgi:hypothetical protein